MCDSFWNNNIFHTAHIINAILITIDLLWQRYCVTISKIGNQSILILFFCETETITCIHINKSGGFIPIHFVSCFINNQFGIWKYFVIYGKLYIAIIVNCIKGHTQIKCRWINFCNITRNSNGCQRDTIPKRTCTNYLQAIGEMDTSQLLRS